MIHREHGTGLRTWAAQVARHRSSKRAIVALARRIGIILHWMWIGGTDFYADGPAQNTA
jgi:transposase